MISASVHCPDCCQAIEWHSPPTRQTVAIGRCGCSEWWVSLESAPRWWREYRCVQVDGCDSTIHEDDAWLRSCSCGGPLCEYHDHCGRWECREDFREAANPY